MGGDVLPTVARACVCAPRAYWGRMFARRLEENFWAGPRVTSVATRSASCRCGGAIS
jgi:hypothetical protein